MSISGPSWTSHLTGVFCDAHNVTENSFKGGSISNNLFSMIRESLPDAVLASIVNWAPINEQIIGDYATIAEEYPDDDVTVTQRVL